MSHIVPQCVRLAASDTLSFDIAIGGCGGCALLVLIVVALNNGQSFTLLRELNTVLHILFLYRSSHIMHVFFCIVLSIISILYFSIYILHTCYI